MVFWVVLWIKMLILIPFYSVCCTLKNMEGRVSSDQDLKLGDTLRYYQRDSNAAKALLVRRLRCLAAYEAANRNLEKARSKNKDVHAVRMGIFDVILKFKKMQSLFFSGIQFTNTLHTHFMPFSLLNFTTKQ